MQIAAPKVREFESGADMRAAAQAVRNKLRSLRPPAVAAPPIAVEAPEEHAPPPVHMSGNVFAHQCGRTERPMVVVSCPDTGGIIEKPFNPPRCQDIINQSARHYNVSPTDILSERRTWNIVRPRQVAAYLCCTITLRGLPFVGLQLGNRDHTTILHARKKIERLLIAGDPDVVESVAAISAELRTRFTF